MKAYEKMILTYINKYENINFNILSMELGIPVSSLVRVADELFLAGYIDSVEQNVFVTDKGKAEVYSSWNEISVNKEERVEQEFKWDDLYIPENFLKKL